MSDEQENIAGRRSVTRGMLVALIVLGALFMVLHAVTGGGVGAPAKGMTVLGLAGLSLVTWSGLRLPWWARVPWALVTACAVLLAAAAGMFALDVAALLVLPAAAVVVVLGVPTWLIVLPGMPPRRQAAQLVGAAVVAAVFLWVGPPWLRPPDTFTEARWRTTRSNMRIGMARDAVTRELLTGLPEAELRRMLGPPGHDRDGHLIWIVGQGLADPMLLDVRLEAGRVASAVVRSG